MFESDKEVTIAKDETEYCNTVRDVFESPTAARILAIVNRYRVNDRQKRPQLFGEFEPYTMQRVMDDADVFEEVEDILTTKLHFKAMIDDMVNIDDILEQLRWAVKERASYIQSNALEEAEDCLKETLSIHDDAAA